jgi:hypothetical protein
VTSSPSKLLQFLEGIADLDDDELAKVVPFVSPRVVRAGIATAARAVPLDAALLDGYIAQTVELMLALRSDHVIAAAAAPAGLPPGDGQADDVDAAVSS